MPRPRLLSFLAAAVALMGCAIGQRVVVVDANNGPGTDHTDLASAFAGLLEDDYIVVRAGTYAPVATTTFHSFVMVGEGNPVVEPVGGGAAMSLTLNGSQYQRVAIRGITFHSASTGQWALTLRTNYAHWPAPTVQLEDCSALSLSPDADRVGLLAESIGLTAMRCTLHTTQVAGCNASFVGCLVSGLDQSFHGPFSQRAQTAMDVLDSEVWLVDSQLVAGNSNGVYGTPASCLGFSESSFSSTSRVHVSGSSSLQADQSPSPLWPFPPFVVEHYQTWWPLPSGFDYEPTTPLVPSPGGAAFSANVTTTIANGHDLRASTAQLGGVFACTAHGDTGDVAILLLATESRANVLLGIPFLMDTGVAAIADFGLVDGTLRCDFAPITLPNDLSLRSVVLQAEAVFVTPGGALLGSNPVSGVLFE